MGWSLAVDLGTTNTTAAVRFGDGSPTELRLGRTGSGLPSAVFLSGASVYVGEAAWDHAKDDPVAFYPSPKRLLMQTPVNQLDTLVPVFAALYREVYRRALSEAGPEAPEVVALTHPEALSERARDLLVTAALDAGIDRNTVDLVSEPVAAAAYYSRRAEVPDQLLIADVGGGTCDIALLRFDSAGSPRILAAEGDNSLGGRTFDGRFAAALAAHLDDGAPDPETLRQMGEPQQHRAIEAARVALSTQDNCTVDLGEDLGAVPWGRADFEELIRGDVTRIADLVERVLGADAGSGTPVSICMTGGAALTPAVQRAVQEEGTLCALESPFTAVCLGALIASSTAAAATPSARSTVSRSPASGRRSLRPRRRTGVVLGGILAAIVLVGGLVLVNRGSSSEEDAGQETGDAQNSGSSTFDPSPVVPVTLAEDSPLFASGSLDCGGVMDAAAKAAKAEYNDHERPSRSGVHGNTSCDLGTDLSIGLTLKTFRPNGFSQFTAYQRNTSGNSSPVALAGDLTGWYRFDTSDLVFGYYIALFVDGYGWIAVAVNDDDAAVTDIGQDIARAVDPVLKIVDRGADS